MIKKLHDWLLSNLKLVRKSEHKSGIDFISNSYSSTITLGKMELEKKYDETIREKDRQINKLKDEIVELKNIKYDFKALVRSFTPAQINALYYEMVSYVRNAVELRHYFPIWFKRMVNAVKTIDPDLMLAIEVENGYNDFPEQEVNVYCSSGQK